MKVFPLSAVCRITSLLAVFGAVAVGTYVRVRFTNVLYDMGMVTYYSIFCTCIQDF